jgi:hypothetical protein
MSKYGLRFDILDSPKDMRSLEDFLMTHRGPYDPAAYEAWVSGKCMPEINAGKRLALGWTQHGGVVADAILVPRSPECVTLKHLRVHPEQWLQGRGMARFLLDQTFHEVIELSEQAGNTTGNVIVDLDTPLGSMAHGFFAAQGFTETGRAALYTPDNPDVLMEKVIQVP